MRSEAPAEDRKKVLIVCELDGFANGQKPVEVERFLRRIAPDTVVLLDETYVEFLSPEYRIDAPALDRTLSAWNSGG